MDDFPSLSLTSPWGPAARRTPVGRGRGRGRYLSLEAENMDEVPLMSDSGEEEEEDEGGGREGEECLRSKRWKNRIKSHSSFVSWLCDGGWLLLLKK